jgi:mRNA-degrading endonuclease RelE of RelBE toxin-antitoxin system
MLTRMHGLPRIRATGDYRVLYTVGDDRLVVLVGTPATAGQIYR